MGLFKFFHATKTFEEDAQREVDCVTRIKQAVQQKCGIDHCIDYDETTVAFAGSKDNMELLLEISTLKCDGKKYLYASLDDKVSWHEWDFDTPDEFENNIIDHIANRVNRTIKTVTEINSKSIREASYYLNENNEWVCFEEDHSDSKWFCRVMNFLTKSSETIKNYKLEADTNAKPTPPSAWDDPYKQLDLVGGKLQSICDDDQDMLLITYNDGMQVDVGYVEEDKTYYITVVQDDTLASWNEPLAEVAIQDKSTLATALQEVIHQHRNTQ